LLFVLFAGTWGGVVGLAALAAPLLVRRLGRERAWTALHPMLALSDVVGVWAGALGAVALFVGRTGFGWAWATAMGFVALMATVSLYDRAVLLPSLDAATKRLAADPDPRWESEWRFLWRMAAWGRWLTFSMAWGAALCALSA
ncbi:MAG: hypothetical protein L6Q95_03450, partial [Planctomycetes bacterium]|nr:hypothetical protein [Planctomycetota bacterium]